MSQKLKSFTNGPSAHSNIRHTDHIIQGSNHSSTKNGPSKPFVGMHVNIERSDGRIHDAHITEITHETNSVSVEWFEEGETKGKEVDLNVLMRNNADKFYPSQLLKTETTHANQVNEQQQSHISRQIKKESVSQKQRKEPENSKIAIATPTRHSDYDHRQLENTLNEMAKISVGMQVNIERSDGRIHGALITKIHYNTKGVSVEWFETGETKGKEIDLNSLIRINPEMFRIVPPMTSSSSANSLSLVGLPTSRSRHSTALSQPQSPGHKLNSTVLIDDLEEEDDSDDLNSRRRTQVLKSIRENKAQKKTIPASAKLPEISEDLILESLIEVTTVSNENEPIITENVSQQKSQLLVNIEEMERNRELRRAQQEQARKQRELQMQIDPGNPKWEFLSMIREYQSQIVYRPLRIDDSVIDNRICVCLRKRPLSKKEIANKEVEVVTIPNKDHVVVHQPQVKVDLTKYLVNHKFRFDYAFNENATNELVYRFSAQPLVKTIFQRGFSTCFAYGQTGSGKTHTMGGIIEGKRQDCTNGIYAMTANDVFTLLHSPEYRNENLFVSCSFFEIYGTKVLDLLDKKAKLRILEDGRHLVQVVGLKEVKVNSVDEVLRLIKTGSDQRTAGQTSANNNSSRSHAVFQIILRKREKNIDILYGKFSLIDLAGNERGADTISSDRQTRLEGAEINKSLLALKECIRAMGRDVNHVPFRGSKLTLVLRDSFVGKNAKTCMISMVSPGMNCVENTMNTLRYANRVKELADEQEAESFEDENVQSRQNW